MIRNSLISLNHAETIRGTAKCLSSNSHRPKGVRINIILNNNRLWFVRKSEDPGRGSRWDLHGNSLRKGR